MMAMGTVTNAQTAMPAIPGRLLSCLKTPGGSDDAVLERVDNGFRDTKTGTFFPDQNGVPSLLSGIDTSGVDKVTGKIKAFYEEHPFPNYDGIEAYGDLVRRGETNPFFKGLLDAIGYNKLVLECGCGTGQLSHFLSLNNNHALGVDLSTSSLKLAVGHKARNNVERVGFVQMNIFDLAIKDGTFDVVISSGVLHHTKDARRAFASIVKKAKPGGLVVVGLYNWFARVPTWVRSKLVSWVGGRFAGTPGTAAQRGSARQTSISRLAAARPGAGRGLEIFIFGFFWLRFLLCSRDICDRRGQPGRGTRAQRHRR